MSHPFRGDKRERYAALGVGEYWLHDPRGRLMRPVLAGHRLVDGAFVPPPATESPDGLSIMSPAPGLELRVRRGDLRVIDPADGRPPPTSPEARAANERAVRDLTTARARIAELERALAERPRG